MKMFIPDIGDRIQLAEDWTFKLLFEYRNTDLWLALKLPYDRDMHRYISEHPMSSQTKKYLTEAGVEIISKTDGTGYRGDYEEYVTTVTFPKSTVLKVDRIYIRKGMKDFSSITFLVEQTSLSLEKVKGAKKTPRFWVNLQEVNKMIIEDTPPTPLLVTPKKKAVKYRVIRWWTAEEYKTMSNWQKQDIQRFIQDRKDGIGWPAFIQEIPPTMTVERRSSTKPQADFIEDMKKQYSTLVAIRLDSYDTMQRDGSYTYIYKAP